MTPMPSDGTGMLPKHALSILELSIRVSRTLMTTALRTYFTAFLTHRTFIQQVHAPFCCISASPTTAIQIWPFLVIRRPFFLLGG